MELLAIAHIILAVLLVILVLLQDSKGGALGVFGAGSSGSLFGSSGGGDFLGKSTKWLAIFFSVTCISLTYITSKKESSAIDSYTPSAESTQLPQNIPANGKTDKKPEPKSEK